MKADLKTVEWSPFYEHTSVSRAWVFMKNVLTHTFERYAPLTVKEVKGKPAPWLSSDVKNLMNERDKLLKKSRRTKEESNISTYKSKRNEGNVPVRKAKFVYHKNLLEEKSSGPNEFWKTLK